MQVHKLDYDKAKHIIVKALTVKNPFATHIATGVKTWEIRKANTKYRGQLYITSSKQPEIMDMVSGAVLCRVLLTETKKVSEMTEEEWYDTCLPQGDKHLYNDQYGWRLESVRRVIEFPINKGQLGIWNLYFTKDTLMDYPIEYMEIASQINEDKPSINWKKWRRRLIRGATIFLLLTALVILLI